MQAEIGAFFGKLHGVVRRKARWASEESVGCRIWRWGCRIWRKKTIGLTT